MSIYQVRSPGTPKPAPRKTKVAVFVTHGMGQQVPFATLNDLLTLIRQVAPFDQAEPKPRAEAVLLGTQRLQRIVLPVDELNREIHFYEGYWAPLTEGVVTLRDVMRFLFRAGVNGIRNSEATFQRYAFGKMQQYDMPVRTWVYLTFALLMVGGLVSMNAVIALIAAARATLNETPAWLTNELFLDLTTTMNVFLLIVFAFGLVLGASGLARGRTPWIAKPLGWLSIASFFLTVCATIVAGAMLPALLLVHYHLGSLAGSGGTYSAFWEYLWGSRWTTLVNDAALGALALVAFLGLLFFLVGPWVQTFIRALIQLWHWSRTTQRRQQPWSTVVVFICLFVLAGLLVAAALELWGFDRTAGAEPLWAARLFYTWPALVGISAGVRYFLIQYMGDVAAYVSSHTVDRFAELRQQIKNWVYDRLKAVYAGQGDNRYDGVVLVGHSLGSVVTYDVLNRLIDEDELQRAAGGGGGPGGGAKGKVVSEFHDVVKRTTALVTFGSPLDKTAFLFAIQQRKTSEAREALATAVQPLIQTYDFRTMPWINIYSPWDIISGALNYYDDTGPEDNPRRVQNQVDPAATTLLVAHTEYWSNAMLREKLAEVLRQAIT
jgi:hypothetical protein